jgi:hypothetical protein
VIQEPPELWTNDSTGADLGYVGIVKKRDVMIHIRLAFRQLATRAMVDARETDHEGRSHSDGPGPRSALLQSRGQLFRQI